MNASFDKQEEDFAMLIICISEYLINAWTLINIPIIYQKSKSIRYYRFLLIY